MVWSNQHYYWKRPRDWLVRSDGGHAGFYNISFNFGSVKSHWDCTAAAFPSMDRAWGFCSQWLLEPASLSWYPLVWISTDFPVPLPVLLCSEPSQNQLSLMLCFQFATAALWSWLMQIPSCNIKSTLQNMAVLKRRSNGSALTTLWTMAHVYWHCLQKVQGLCLVSH